MARRRLGSLVVVAFVVLVGGCSGASASNGPAGGGGGGGGGGGTPALGGVSGGGGNLSTVDSCALLKPEEIKQVLGIAMSAGVNQDSDQVKQCEWDPQDGSSALTVGIDVRPFTDSDWQVVSEFPHAAPVSGLGEAAYKGSPLQGDLSVKYHGYEIDLGIANFTTKSQAVIDQANVALMNLILPRL